MVVGEETSDNITETTALPRLSLLKQTDSYPLFTGVDRILD
jgi:hypothetical protein